MSSEGGFSVVDDGFFTAGKPYFHDIEADGDAAIQESQPVPGTAAQQFAFSPVHGSGGRTVCQGGIAFHLDEYQYIALTADDIHLTGISPAEVSPQHAEPLCAQPRCGYQLTVFAYVAACGRGIRSPGAAPSVQQVQTCGDDVA